MKIIIPMSGLGSRFIRVGYQDVKPLIDVQGKSIIEWVLRLFPGETDITFICRDEHLKETPMQSILEKLCPTGKIIGIEGQKKGPVYAVLKALEAIDDNEPTLVSYCDYYMHWDYEDFKKTVLENGCDGCIPCYTGFHPHLIPEKNLYASCRVNKNMYLEEIKEKFSFTKDKTKSLHSPGAYYFKNGAIMKKYFQMMLNKDLNLNGEYYVSLVYNFLVQDDLNVYVYDKVPHFCQWGTPEDLEEFNFWMNILKRFKK